jgi:hypothetical protein
LCVYQYCTVGGEKKNKKCNFLRHNEVRQHPNVIYSAASIIAVLQSSSVSYFACRKWENFFLYKFFSIFFLFEVESFLWDHMQARFLKLSLTRSLCIHNMQIVHGFVSICEAIESLRSHHAFDIQIRCTEEHRYGVSTI